MDSFDIALWADNNSQAGDTAKLFPEGQLKVIRKCDSPPVLLFFRTCIAVLIYM